MTQDTTMLSRRRFLTHTALGLAAASLPWSNIALAQAATEKRVVIVLLHGGLDGVSLFPPHGDHHYRELRGPLAIPEPIELSEFFGLHPAAEALLPFWARGELLVFPATASPFQGTDHSAARRVLETGGTTSDGLKTGWLNRLLQGMEGPKGLAVQNDMPLILKGPAATSIWQKERLQPIEGLHERLGFINETDSFLAHALSMSRRRQLDDQAVLPHDVMDHTTGSLNAFDQAAVAPYIGRLLATEDGPRIAVLESTGWDMHQRQGAEHGRQARRFAALAATLEGLAAGMGPVWDETVVLVVSEFGRKLQPNAWEGTDNGGATATFALGGSVKGGRFLGKWPGLSPSKLNNGGLAPSMDMRAIFKGVLSDHLKISATALNKSVFPGSDDIKPITGLIR